MDAPKLPLAFWKNVAVVGECWLWVGPKDANGHGVTHIRHSHKLAHHAMWEAAHACVLHKGAAIRQSCGHPACVRPDHLQEGKSLRQTAPGIMASPGTPSRGKRPTP